MSERSVSPDPTSTQPEAQVTSRGGALDDHLVRSHCHRLLRQISDFLTELADQVPPDCDYRRSFRLQAHRYKALSLTPILSPEEAKGIEGPVRLLHNQDFEYDLSEFQYILPHLVAHWQHRGHSIEEIEAAFSLGARTIPIEEPTDFDYAAAEHHPTSDLVHYATEAWWSYDEFGEPVDIYPPRDGESDEVSEVDTDLGCIPQD